MDSAEARKLIALILVSMILVAAAAWMASKDRSSSIDHETPSNAVTSDPLKSEFERCQLPGEAGAHDPACLAAWAENRRRFLAPDRRPAALNPAETPAATEGR